MRERKKTLLFYVPKILMDLKSMNFFFKFKKLFS